MKIDILTLFPGLFTSPFSESILGKAQERGLLSIQSHFLRDWAEGKHKITDDTPYGGGDGMVMKPEPIARALQDLRQKAPESSVLLMTPQGQRFCQEDAQKLAGEKGLIFVCGRYEGYDERIRSLADAEYSVGDFVLTGGEPAAMVMIDAIGRLLPGVLGCSSSAEADSFSDGLLEYPQYTRPEEFAGRKVPSVLLSGNHAEIARWRRREQLKRTLQRRPELLESAVLDDTDRRMLAEIMKEVGEGDK
jgi:tRNA (guanine37-N1)-methyltransferase